MDKIHVAGRFRREPGGKATAGVFPVRRGPAAEGGGAAVETEEIWREACVRRVAGSGGGCRVEADWAAWLLRHQRFEYRQQLDKRLSRGQTSCLFWN